MSKPRSKGLSALRPKMQQDTGAGTPSAGVSLPVADGEASGSHQQPGIVFDIEVDGRHIAESKTPPCVIAYGATKAEAKANLIAIWNEASGSHQQPCWFSNGGPDPTCSRNGGTLVCRVCIGERKHSEDVTNDR